MTYSRLWPNRNIAFYYLLCLLWLADRSTASCYWLDGTDVNAYWNVSDLYYYQPCHNDTASNATAASMCCATGPGRVADGNADRCVAQGLCYSDALKLYWRESCTDPTWQDPACIKLFVNGTNNGTDVALTACSDGSWCADNVSGSQACCDAGNGFVITRDGTVTQHDGSTVSSASVASSGTPTSASAGPQSSAPSGSSSSSISTTSTPSTTTPISSPSPAPSSSGLSSGAKAGIGVGAALGVIALLISAYFFLRRSRRNTGPKDSSHQAQELYNPPPPAEMQATSVYPEMDQHQASKPKSTGPTSGLGTTATPAQLE